MCTSYLSTVAIAHLYVLFLFCVFTSIPGGAHRSCVLLLFLWLPILSYLPTFQFVLLTCNYNINIDDYFKVEAAKKH